MEYSTPDANQHTHSDGTHHHRFICLHKTLTIELERGTSIPDRGCLSRRKESRVGNERSVITTLSHRYEIEVNISIFYIIGDKASNINKLSIIGDG